MDGLARNLRKIVIKYLSQSEVTNGGAAVMFNKYIRLRETVQNLNG